MNYYTIILLSTFYAIDIVQISMAHITQILIIKIING